MATYPSGAPMKTRAPVRKPAFSMATYFAPDCSPLWRERPYADRMQMLAHVAACNLRVLHKFS